MVARWSFSSGWFCFFFSLILDLFAFPQMLNTSWGNAGSDWIEQLVRFLAEGQGILWFSLQIAPICTAGTYSEYI